MAHRNAFAFDLSDEAARVALPLRHPTYWQITEYGRAIGYQHYDLDRSFCVACLSGVITPKTCQERSGSDIPIREILC